MHWQHSKKYPDLNENQHQILEYIIEFQSRYSFQPSIEEISKWAQRSKSAIRYSLDRLVDKEYLIRFNGHRSCSLNSKKLGVIIKMFRGKVLVQGMPKLMDRKDAERIAHRILECVNEEPVAAPPDSSVDTAPTTAIPQVSTVPDPLEEPKSC